MDQNNKSGTQKRLALKPMCSELRNKTWLILGVLVVAANLRAAITGVGPLVRTLSADTGMSSTVAGLLTTLPLVAFAAFSPLAPKIARRLSIEYALFVGLICLALGILVRSTATQASLLIGMFVAGAGIALGNTLLPSLIKRDFPNHIGWMTGIYSVAMSGFAAIASGVSVPLAHFAGLGWRGSLSSWIVLSIIGLLIWIPQLRNPQFSQTPSGKSRLWKSALAWQVTLFMGFQSFTFYVNVAWLPALLQSRGMGAANAGWMLFFMQFVSLPASLFVSVIAGKRRNQQSLVVWVTVFFLLGYGWMLDTNLGLVYIPIALIGAAGGASISLALTLIGLRSANSIDAAQLSGMAQSIGYLLAAIGPIVVGRLHDVSHAWTASLIVLLVDVILMLLVGIGAGRDKLVSAVESTREGSAQTQCSQFS